MMQNCFKNFIIILFVASAINTQAATPTISDSIDIRHINLILDITDYADNTISGSAELDIKIKVDNISFLPLDLIGLTVDSVLDNTGNTLAFTHLGELLNITLPSIFNTDDSTKITVYYHGEPEQDGSWGGWYWNGDYAYQLGVGFDAVPHNFGRIWFPCFDNFIERSTYRYEIKTEGDKKAYCGGLLESEIDNGDGTKTWIWNCNQTIPSYLASVAVSTYTSYTDTYVGIDRDIPIEIAVKPEDSTDLAASFINLHSALSTYENHYGAYAWDRIGYAIVPFNGGAMEHAMNIAYPLFAVNGFTTWETLYAHELSHHWWGNLITCSSAEEMWMNEGWAVFSEHLFTEILYGEDAYTQAVQTNHKDVIHYAAAQDGENYFPISNVPSTYTYGYTTYKKGADVIHTLRGYLGDDLFFDCIKSFLATYQFKAVSAADLRDHLTECSGIDMNDFFDGWVYQAGFPGFEIDDIGYTPLGINSVCIQQKLHHANELCNSVPLTLNFFDENWIEVSSMPVMVSGEHTQISFTDVNAKHVVIDYHQKINDAVTEDKITIDAAATYSLKNGLIDITVNNITTPVFVYAQHYWVAADQFKTEHPGIHLNNQRYWKISGTFGDDFDATAKLLYNGQQTLGGGYLDDTFITNSDDSLLLFYRANPTDEWTIYPYYELNDWGSSIDKRGALELSKLQQGEYVIGIYDSELPDAPLYTALDCPDFLEISISANNMLKIFPNPADENISIQISNADEKLILKIVNTAGDTVRSIPLQYRSQSISVKTLPSGTYQLYVENAQFTRIAAQKLMIIH